MGEQISRAGERAALSPARGPVVYSLRLTYGPVPPPGTGHGYRTFNWRIKNAKTYHHGRDPARAHLERTHRTCVP